jgi:hypothetical protein
LDWVGAMLECANRATLGSGRTVMYLSPLPQPNDGRRVVAVSGRNTAPTGMEGIVFALAMCKQVSGAVIIHPYGAGIPFIMYSTHHDEQLT